MKAETVADVTLIDHCAHVREEGRSESGGAVGGTRLPCGHGRTERLVTRESAPVVAIPRDNALSFETLVRRLSPTLKKIAYKLNVPFVFVDDQDLVQEALIHLWTQFTSGSLRDKTDSYILQGCYFHLKNYLRKVQEPCAVISLGQPGGEDGAAPEDILDARSLLCYDEVEGNLQIEAMEESGITQREKKVLLFSLEGMTTREIGKELGISHVSVVKIRNKIKEKYVSLNGGRASDAHA